MSGEENVFQLQFLELGFQIIDLCLSILVAVFQNFMTGFFSTILGGLGG